MSVPVTGLIYGVSAWTGPYAFDERSRSRLSGRAFLRGIAGMQKPQLPSLTEGKLSALEKGWGSILKRGSLLPSFQGLFPEVRESEQHRHCPVHLGDAQEGRVKRLIEEPIISATQAVFGVVRMTRVGHGVHDLLVPGQSSPVLEWPRRAPPISRAGALSSTVGRRDASSSR